MFIKTSLKTTDMTIDKTAGIQGYAKRLKLSELTANVQDILLKAQKESPSYDDFLSYILVDIPMICTQ